MKLNWLSLLDGVSCTLIPVHVPRVMSFVNFPFPLISRYLAGDASDSDSGDESGGDEDDDEPEESPKGESENQDDDKLDDSKYKKKVDDIKAKFAERFRILEERNPTQIFPVYTNPKQKPSVQPQTEEPRDVPQFRCQEPGCGKICSSSAGLKNHTRTHRRDRQSLTASH